MIVTRNDETMNRNNFTLLSLIIVTLFILVSSCRTIPDYQKLSTLQLPKQFQDQKDSTSVADLPWNKVFTDPYLRTLIDTTLHANWDLQQAFQRIEIARANYEQTTGALHPVVTGVINAALDRFSSNTDKDIGNLPGNPTTEFFVGLQSSWEIDIWNKLKRRKRAALQRFFASQQGLQLLKTTLVVEVSKRYYDLLKLDNQLTIVRKNIVLQKSAVDVIAIQKEGGRATELAVQQFQAQLLNTQGLEVNYQQQITEIENELNVLMGRLPKSIKRSDTLIINRSLTHVRTGYPSALLVRRPDIQEAALNLLANESDIEAARALFFPTITISPYVGINTLRAANIFDPGSVVFGLVGGLTAPIFNRIAIAANYKRTKAAAREAFYNYQKTINQSYSEVVTTLIRINNLEKIYNLKRQQTAALENAVSTSQDLYLAGYASYLEVILAQANVLEAELEMVNSKSNLNQSFIDLYRSLGGGWK